MNSGRNAISIIFCGLIALASTIFFAARYYRTRGDILIGRLSEVDGRVECRDDHETSSHGVTAGDIVNNGSSLKVGPSGMAKISGPMGTLIAGPDTSIKLQKREKTVTVQLESGEIIVRQGTTKDQWLVSTAHGTVMLSTKSDVIVSQPSGRNYVVIESKSGEAKVIRKSQAQQTLTPLTSPLLLAQPNETALWIKSPEPELSISAKEGFAAVGFSWHTTKNSPSANILVRNLTTGEMTIHEASSLRDDITLPVGSYSWSINTDGLISTVRRFHIKGTPPGELIASERIESEPTQVKDSINEQATDQDQKLKPQSKTPPLLEKPKITLLGPKEGTSIPVDSLTEQRVQWSTSGDVDSIDLEILGSSGNPAKQFTLQRDRTRRRLPALPPGRYTVRVRANGNTGDVSASSPWAETFFDVVQTEAGQLAPSDVKVSTSKKGNVSYVLVEWSKSTAPRYQVTLNSEDAPAKVARTIKSQVLLNMPKNPIKTIEVCALDANLQVRGCAPKVENPEL